MNPFTEVSPWPTDGGFIIGRDPRAIPESEWALHRPDVAIGLRAMRAKCLDCAGGFSAEVRKCTAIRCALWPFRMGVVPKGLRALRKGRPDADAETDADGEEPAIQGSGADYGF